MTIGIIGAGNMGTALGVLAARAGHEVKIWDIDRAVLDEISARRTNARLPGVEIPRGITAVRDVQSALTGVAVVFVVVPSHAASGVAPAVSALPSDVARITATKGWDPATRRLPHEALGASALGGSSVAAQFIRGVPTTFVAGCASPDIGRKVKDALSGATICVTVTDDVTGVALGGALKNIYAIASGILDAHGSSSNTKAMLVAAAAGEMAALGEALGGKRETLLGLAGLGDLVGTSFAPESRNRLYGEALGRDGFAAAGPARLQAEGSRAAPIARAYASEHGLALPLLEILDEIIAGRAAPDSLGNNLARLCVRG